MKNTTLFLVCISKIQKSSENQYFRNSCWNNLNWTDMRLFQSLFQLELTIIYTSVEYYCIWLYGAAQILLEIMIFTTNVQNTWKILDSKLSVSKGLG